MDDGSSIQFPEVNSDRQALDRIHALGDGESVFDWVPLPCMAFEITADAECVGGLSTPSWCRRARISTAS